MFIVHMFIWWFQVFDGIKALLFLFTDSFGCCRYSTASWQCCSYLHIVLVVAGIRRHPGGAVPGGQQLLRSYDSRRPHHQQARRFTGHFWKHLDIKVSDSFLLKIFLHILIYLSYSTDNEIYVIFYRENFLKRKRMYNLYKTMFVVRINVQFTL